LRILDFNAPEGGVGFAQGYADVPCFVPAPDHLTLCAAPSIRKDQADFAPERQIGTHYGHATGMAHVYCHAICAAPAASIFPFDKEAKTCDGAFMGPHSCPAFFELVGQR
jgi:hypothetical protein